MQAGLGAACTLQAPQDHVVKLFCRHPSLLSPNPRVCMCIQTHPWQRPEDPWWGWTQHEHTHTHHSPAP